MSYRVTRDAGGLPVIALTGEPPYCHAFHADRPAHRPDLETDRLLLMAFAVWSAPDVAAVQVALDVARHFDGALGLVLRPYDDPEELRPWLDGEVEAGRGPHWILREHGAVTMRRDGPLSVGELVDLIDGRD
jgi:hypothetical protein